ncbi:hypothetical protein HWB57_gp064 [Erwinia phage vB_EamM-Bue1]|uniref:Uncharacterized protein n=1 Tax=Erwinia phage vB_EamM-Bue1 TaxID=2099338 RepID=A0A2P1JU74_9CAUD|nr:hypothetical protein HWB57_gp064 [Erwinia phage vB_EamM-Bue1]AVO22904.1 hypothetical protein [Erwinia phage vB_EamM-Bue1]
MFFEMCDVMKSHNYSMFEINDMMPWHLDVLTEKAKNRKPS